MSDERVERLPRPTPREGRRRGPTGRRRRGRSVATIAIAILVSGCNLFATPSAPHPSRESRTPEPIVVPSDPPDEAETLPPDTGSIGFAAAANGLADLQSYRVRLTSTGLVPSTAPDGQVAMTSTLIQTSSPAAEFTMDGVDGFVDGHLEAIVIGDEAWLREGSGGWRKSPGGAADFDAAFTSLSPIDLATEFDDLSAALEEVGPEARDQRATIHYRTDAGNAGAVNAGLSAGTADLWVDPNAKYLVGLEVAGTWDVDGTATPVTLRIDVTHVDDRANAVKRPR
jgi:hypothetical protein